MVYGGMLQKSISCALEIRILVCFTSLLCICFLVLRLRSAFEACRTGEDGDEGDWCSNEYIPGGRGDREIALRERTWMKESLWRIASNVAK